MPAPPGAGTALTEREGQRSSECDRRADIWGDKTLLCPLHRAAGWEGGAGRRRRGPGTGGTREAGAGAGARVNIMALVAQKCSKAKAQAHRCEPHWPNRAP